MSENVKNVNETNVEVVNDVQPVPETMNYEQTVLMTETFVNDVVGSLANLSYAETHVIIDFVRNNKTNPIPISMANQLINQLASYPWGAVNVLMSNIENNQGAYFVLQTDDSNKDD